MNESERQSWALQRTGGKRRYILTRGVLGFGVVFGSIIAGVRAVSRGVGGLFEFLLLWIFAMIFCGALGSLFMRAEWEKNERAYLERNDKNAPI